MLTVGEDADYVYYILEIGYMITYSAFNKQKQRMEVSVLTLMQRLQCSLKEAEEYTFSDAFLDFVIDINKKSPILRLGYDTENKILYGEYNSTFKGTNNIPA